MMREYKILNEPLKVTHSFEYTLNDHLKLSFAKRSLLFPIIEQQTGAQLGFYYDGPIGFIADFLVHTKKGAVGYTIERSYQSLFLFPSKIDFLIEYTKESKPIDEQEFAEAYTSLLKGTKFSFSLIKQLNSLTGLYYLFFVKKPFSLWMAEKNKTFYISPPRVLGRDGDSKLFLLTTKELIFVDSDGSTISTSDFYTPGTIMKKLRDWIFSLGPSPFTTIFRDFCNY